MFKQVVLLGLLLCWLSITVFQSWYVGELEVKNNLYHVKLKEKEYELKYCLLEIKKLVIGDK